jgi:hypothetical protein
MAVSLHRGNRVSAVHDLQSRNRAAYSFNVNRHSASGLGWNP